MDYLGNQAACIATLCGAALVSLGIASRLLRRYKDLTDKVVLITGASSGIGEALASGFLRSGCRLVLAARTVAKLEQLKAQLIDIHKVAADRIKVVYLDLANHSTIPPSANQCLGCFGHIDILVNNAGIGSKGQVVSTSLDVYKQIMNVNYFGQVALTKEILPSMISRRSGSIVAMSSLQGRFAIPFSSAYGASKHALQAYCDSLRAETTGQNIHVLVVSPSYVDTNFFAHRLLKDGTTAGADDQLKIKGMASEYVANETVTALRQGKTELALGPLHHRLAVYLRVLAPRLHATIMSRMNQSNM